MVLRGLSILPYTTCGDHPFQTGRTGKQLLYDRARAWPITNTEVEIRLGMCTTCMYLPELGVPLFWSVLPVLSRLSAPQTSEFTVKGD